LIVDVARETGVVDVDKFFDLCAEPDVGLASIILAHNEIGIVQPIGRLGKAIARAREHRAGSTPLASRPLLPLYHLDATQLLGKGSFSRKTLHFSSNRNAKRDSISRTPARISLLGARISFTARRGSAAFFARRRRSA
jgi:cysteine sulfinate desulfinase/cysteine desulfurase-like protein